MIVLLVGSIVSVSGVSPDANLINTLFNVSGILFSIGLGLIVSFDMSGVKNKKMITSLRENIANVRNNFIIYFTIVTIFYVASFYLTKPLPVYRYEYNFGVLVCSIILYSIAYFVKNFVSVQKLKSDIFDELNKQA